MKKNKKYRRRLRLKKKLKKSKFKIKYYVDDASPQANDRSSTAFAHPKCYANIFNECSQNISKEHFISQSILNKFEVIYPADIEYLKGILKKPIKPNMLSVNCLCEYHNSLLSPLDSMIGHFFESTTRFYDELNTGFVFKGKNLELWFTKCLIGYLATNKLSHNGVKFSITDLDPSLLNFLFRGEPLPSEYGLYYADYVGKKSGFSKRFKLQALFLDNKFSGISILFGGFKFYFSLEKRERAFNEKISNAVVLYRPKLFKKVSSRDFIKIEW
jgi:hypothetical protein